MFPEYRNQWQCPDSGDVQAFRVFLADKKCHMSQFFVKKVQELLFERFLTGGCEPSNPRVFRVHTRRPFAGRRVLNLGTVR